MLVALGVCLAFAPVASSTFARRDGEILSYNEFSPPEVGFWLSAPDGHRPQFLTVPPPVLGTAGGGPFTFPTFSPSGRLLAFLFDNARPAPRPWFYGIEVSNAAGKSARVLVRGPLSMSFIEMSGLAFSPDGRVLVFGYVFARHIQPNSHKFVNPFATRFEFVSVKTGKLLRSLTLVGDLEGLAWSATGALSFISDGSLYALRPDGTHRRRIKIRFPASASADWSIDTTGENRPVSPAPDGSMFAVDASNDACIVSGDASLRASVATARCGDIEDVFLVPATGGKAKRIGRNGVASIWSPSGRQIMFGFDGAQTLITLATKREQILHIPGAPLAWQARPKATARP